MSSYQNQQNYLTPNYRNPFINSNLNQPIMQQINPIYPAQNIIHPNITDHRHITSMNHNFPYFQPQSSLIRPRNPIYVPNYYSPNSSSPNNQNKIQNSSNKSSQNDKNNKSKNF